MGFSPLIIDRLAVKKKKETGESVGEKHNKLDLNLGHCIYIPA